MDLPLVQLLMAARVQFDKSGNFISVSFTATAQDLCPLLQ